MNAPAKSAGDLLEAAPLEAVEQARRTLIDLGIRYGPKLFTALLLLAIGLWLGRRFGALARAWLTRRELEPPLRQLLTRLVSVAVVLVFSLMALQNLGVELLPLLASLGVAGVGLGLATQGVLSNVVAGLTIIFTRPFKVGEYVAMLGVEGRVETIGLFSTELSHPDRSRVLVPNRKIVGEILHNYGSSRQLDLSVGVSYATDLTQALAKIHEVLRQSPKVLREPDLDPFVGVQVLADSSINISVRPWVAVVDHAAATAEIYQRIVEVFRAARIEIPFPQRELRLLGPGSPAGPGEPGAA